MIISSRLNKTAEECITLVLNSLIKNVKFSPHAKPVGEWRYNCALLTSAHRVSFMTEEETVVPVG